MGKSKATSKTEPWTEAKPYVLNASNAVQGDYNANKGAVSDIAGQVQGLLPSLIQRYNAGNPAVNAATGYNTDVLQGKYLNGNPHLQGVIDNTNNDIRNQVGASLGTRGRTGGDSYFSIMARELAKNENNLRFGDYNAERDRMGAAAGQTPGLAASDYAAIAPVLATAGAGTQLPFAASNNYADAIARLLGNYTSTQQTQTPSTMNMIGQGAQGVGSLLAGIGMLSDKRAKTDIKKVGKLDDGLGVYTYRYKGGDTPMMGVMAQEVEKKRPWALGGKLGEYQTVNYGAL